MTTGKKRKRKEKAKGAARENSSSNMLFMWSGITLSDGGGDRYD